VRPLWQQLSLAELAEDVDRQLLVLSHAHLDRYFPDISDNDSRRSAVNEQGGGSV
jgi:hypothetical protein